MATFKDNVGREWAVDVNSHTIETVHDAIGVDLWTWDVFARFGADVRLMVDVIYILCRDQADAAGVSDVDFGRSLWGVIDGAAVALLEAAAEYHPSGRRKLFREMAAKVSAAVTLWEQREAAPAAGVRDAVV
jgi:hypothetical protein